MKAISLYQVSKNSKRYNFEEIPKNTIEVDRNVIHFANRRKRFRLLQYYQVQTAWSKNGRHFKPIFTKFYLPTDSLFQVLTRYYAWVIKKEKGV